MKSKEQKLVCFRLSIDIHKKLVRLSEREERTISSKIRLILNDFLESDSKN